MTLDEIKSKLKAAGFREYKTPQPIDHVYAESRWQMWVYDHFTHTKRYAVNAYVYGPIEKSPPGIQFSALFYQTGDGPAFDVEVLFQDDIHKALAFFADIFKRMDCIPDPHNNP